MEITKKTVVELAALARLNIDASKHETWAEDLGSIFKLFDALDEVELKDKNAKVEEQSVEPLREDKAGKSFDIEEVETMAPDWQDSSFLVPKVL